MSHLLQFLILLMDENLFRDPFLSPHTMAACDDCLAQGASECTCQNPETGSQLAAAGPGTHSTGRQSPAARQTGPGSRAQAAAGGSCYWPVSVTAVTAARPRLPGPHTLVLSSHWRDVTLSLAWAPWSRDHSRPWPGTWPGPAEQIVCITGLSACDQGRLWSREQDNQAQEQR